MSHTPIPAPVQALAPDLARRIGLIVAALAALVARRFLQQPHLQSLIVPLWTYLTRAATRFTRLMARLAANRAPKPRPPRPHRPTQNTARAASPLPAGHGWLIRALPGEAAIYASQLEALLADPATANLLAEHPAAARLLRPLARMLGLQTLAPKRHRPKPSTQATPPPTPPASHRPTTGQLSGNRPNGDRPTTDRPNTAWPYAYRPSANWPAACRRRTAPA